MKRICYINGRFLTQSPTGVQRYARELLSALNKLIDTGEIDPAEFRFTLLTPRTEIADPHLAYIPIRRVGRFSGHLWEQLDLPRYSRDGLLINLCNTGPALASHQVITIHDAGFMAMPASYTRPFRTWYHFLLRRLGQTATAVITVSEFSRKELIDRLHISSGKIHVIHHGREHIERLADDDSIISDRNLTHRPFLLAVSSLSPRKNFPAVIEAINRPGLENIDILIAGGLNPRVFGQSEIPAPDRVRYLGQVTDAQLKSLYRHAAAIVYPSLYEGFGLPPLEAMTCGCPVIVSDIPPHREVCGDAALYCDPHDIDDIAKKIRTLITDPERLSRLRQAGLDRARQFSWRKTAAHFLDILRHTTS